MPVWWMLLTASLSPAISDPSTQLSQSLAVRRQQAVLSVALSGTSKARLQPGRATTPPSILAKDSRLEGVGKRPHPATSLVLPRKDGSRPRELNLGGYPPGPPMYGPGAWGTGAR